MFAVCDSDGAGQSYLKQTLWGPTERTKWTLFVHTKDNPRLGQ